MTLVGIHEQYHGPKAITPQKTLDRFPLTMYTREFVNSPIPPQNLIPKLENTCGEVWDTTDCVPVWSVKPNPADVYNGKWRPFFEQLASYAKSNPDRPFVLVIWHEPENDVPKSFKTPEDFVRLFNTVHDWVKAVNPALQTCHAALGYRYADRIDIDDKTAKRWRTKADINAIDIYSGRSFPLDTILPELSGFRRWHVHVVGDKPWAVSERNWITKPDGPQSQLRADTILREGEWLATTPVGRNCLWHIVFNTPGTENDPKIVLDAVGERAKQEFDIIVTRAVTQPEPTQPSNTKTITCPLCHGDGTYSFVVDS